MTQAKPKAELSGDSKLRALQASFERGDFVGLHEQLAQLPEAERGAPGLRPLLGSTSVDPAHVGVLALCALALIAITLAYLR